MFSNYYTSLMGHVSPNKMHETDVQVVVISPEDREQVERVASAYHESDHIAPWPELHSITREAITDAMQAALRSLVTPPKPLEPTGLGAVVEDTGCNQWVLINVTGADVKPTRQWRTWWGNRPYADINAVRVLSEGWSE